MGQRYLIEKYRLDGTPDSGYTARFKCPDSKCYQELKSAEQKIGQRDTCPHCGVPFRLAAEPLQLKRKRQADVAQELSEQKTQMEAETERVQQQNIQQKRRAWKYEVSDYLEWKYPEGSIGLLDFFIVLSIFLAGVGAVLLIVAGVQAARAFGGDFEGPTYIMLLLLVPLWVVATLLPAILIKTVMYYLERLTIGVERLHNQSQ